MRDLFSWRLKPSEEDFTDLWKGATFVFDTNFLLDLYRVSHSTAQDFFNILECLEEKIWLPYQVASEFLDRREETIKSESKSFQKALESLKKWKDEQLSFQHLKGLLGGAGRVVSSEVGFLFEQQDTYKAVIEEVENCFRDKIEELAKINSSLNSEEDYILEKILLLFDGKVGNPYSASTLQELYKEGEERYKHKKPPGFMDAKDKEGERKYGDFILWKQILDFATTKSCSIVLVTGEKKEDWWIKKEGAIISPHLELRREFQGQVNQLFWMYPTQRFLEIAREQLEIEVSPRSIKETNVVAEAEAAEAAEEKSYEDISQALQQLQAARISEDLLKAFRTPTISEDMFKALRTSLISEDTFRALRTPLISEDTFRALRTPLISEDMSLSSRISLMIEDMLKVFFTPLISEGLPKMSSQAYRSLVDTPQLPKSKENSVVPENIETDLSDELSDELMSGQHSNHDEDAAGNCNSIENKPEARNQHTKPQEKRGSSSKKSKGNNSGK
jgi:predicted nucleic acid-binding protein